MPVGNQRLSVSELVPENIPLDIVYEDDTCVAFRDIQPQAPTHILVVPRKPIENVAALEPDDAALAGHLLVVAAQIARQEGLTNGFRAVLNTGADGGQSVDHLHLHLLGGRPLRWPPG